MFEEVEGAAAEACVGHGAFDEVEAVGGEAGEPFADEVELAGDGDPRGPGAGLVEGEGVAEHEAVGVVVPDAAVEEVEAGGHGHAGEDLVPGGADVAADAEGVDEAE